MHIRAGVSVRLALLLLATVNHRDRCIACAPIFISDASSDYNRELSRALSFDVDEILPRKNAHLYRRDGDTGAQDLSRRTDIKVPGA